ncbi:MAG: helix-turn-helix domain-containing protein [Verrucomicrobia bacterium]|jgi:transcriptional regulator with XRE-family HTH domain|nr:helix-turn-helix domain-containing protein [Verrucomicrobiota bacterium]
MQAFSCKNLSRAFSRYNVRMQRGRKPIKEAPPFGKYLARLRKERGLTQYEFADLLGISRNLVLHYERNCANPTMEFIVKAAKVLDTSTDELIGLSRSAAKRGPSPKALQIAERISTLPKAKQSIVVSMLEGAIEQVS